MQYILFFLLLNTSLFANFHASISPISASIKQQMTNGHSWRKECPVGLDALRLVRVSYVDFEHQTQQGALIVHKDVATQIVSVFHTLYEHAYPIEKMKLVSHYNADDERSMSANNTSAFNCRNIANTSRWSKHSYGKALDINPVQNPCVIKTKIYPQIDAAKRYKARTLKHPAMIKKDDLVYRLFKQNGWNWGGDWKSLKDYQHFEKK